MSYNVPGAILFLLGGINQGSVRPSGTDGQNVQRGSRNPQRRTEL